MKNPERRPAEKVRLPLVSVVVATYNGERFLEAQLESIYAQSYKRIEVIASDDCSSDGTVRILNDYSDSRGLVVVEHDSNVGSTKNFDGAIGRASGELIAFADQDDVWLPEKIGLCVSRLLEDGADIVFGNASIVDASLAPSGRTLWEMTGFSHGKQSRLLAGGGFGLFLAKNYVTGATMLARAELVRRFRPISPMWIHDGWIAILAAVYDAHISFVDKELMLYRQHGAQQIGTSARAAIPDSRDWFDHQSRAWGDLADFIRARGGPPPGHEDRLELIESKAMHLAVRRDLPPGRFSRVLPVLRELSTGRYRAFSKGAASVIRDLLSPAQAPDRSR
jgi:glycosyltransferase involved in cell wall biosynthesis